jgi:hypothetical protein
LKEIRPYWESSYGDSLPEVLWYRVLRSKYEGDANGWDLGRSTLVERYKLKPVERHF